MQITMKQSEIEIAVMNYIQQTGLSQAVKEVTFTATRGAEGITAEIELSQPEQADIAVAVTPAPVAKQAKQSKPAVIAEPIPFDEAHAPAAPEDTKLFG
jgi:hypothetical protein